MTIIGHLDMDAFFAAVEEREKPWLRGSPIVVGADPSGGAGRGVVSTANYKAREYGIHSAMPISKAWWLAEEGRARGDVPTVFITPRFGKYGIASKEIVEVVRAHVPNIQKTSVDEMYFDLSHTDSYDRAEMLAHTIKESIKKKTKLTGSIGVGPNKMIAKIASDFRKPDGLTVVREAEAEQFMAPLSVRAIPGIGPKMEEKLARLGVRCVSDLRALSEGVLHERFGMWGASLYRKARGEGSIDLSERPAAKSVGEHRTFSEDTRDMRVVMSCLSLMAGDIIRRMETQEFEGFRTAVLTIRFSDFETKQRSVTVKNPMHTAKELELKAMKSLLPFFEKKENPQSKPIRMVGLRVEKLV